MIGQQSGGSALFPRISAWAGVLGFPLFFIALTIDGLITPGYSTIGEHGSDLSVLSQAWLFDYSLTAFGVSLIIFAIGFHRAISSSFTRRRAIAVTTLLLISATGGLLAGIFTVASTCLYVGSECVPYVYIHALGGVLIFGFPPVAQIVAGGKLRRVFGSEKYGKYTLITGVVMLATVIFSTFYPIMKFDPALVPLVSALDNQYAGLLQRIEMIGTWGWFSVSGMKLLKMDRRGIFQFGGLKERKAADIS